MKTNIIVYTSNLCSTCQMTKEYLKLQNQSFIEKNVSIDIKARKELIEMGIDTTPVTLIGRDKIVGFNSSKIDNAIDKLL
ncbi:glutaredoxin family protein [Dehalococcoidia bacterium]|nr:glutaredoxin family protein [Dehalococcoidia bacterium]